MTRLSRIRQRPTESRFSIEDLALQLQQIQFVGGGSMVVGGGINTTWSSQSQEPIPNSLQAYAQQAYAANGIIFALVGVRMRLFSEVRFQWQDMAAGPGKLFGNTDLRWLESPWPGATTGDLLARIEQYVSLAGNAYVYRDENRRRLKVLRPDWTTVVIGSDLGPDDFDPNGLDAELAGYIYKPGGPGSKSEPIMLRADQVAHVAPVPDPEAQFRGMSWMTPVLNEISADKAATQHKLKFFENAATPNMAITYPKEVTAVQVAEYLKLLDEEHAGVANAYKTLHLGGGADPKVIGVDLKSLDFKAIQGAGETRMAAASGIAPIVAGLSEGLEASTYSNMAQARRAVGDQWARPAWRNVAGSLEQILPPPDSARLWYDASDVSFLQEDQKDAAEILYRDASTTRTLVDAGFDPLTVVDAVKSGDLGKLTHSGLYSVQLQKPGGNAGTPPAA